VKRALDLATSGAERHPTDDEIAVLRAQFLRRDGQARAALGVLQVVVQRNRRAPNAWAPKVRLELELGEPADSILASLEHAIANQYERAIVAATARGIGQTAAKDTTAPNRVESLRAVLRYLKFSDATQANDTTTLLIGTTNVTLASRLANDPATAKQCDAAKELATAVVDARVALPKVGCVFPDVVARSMQIVLQLAPHSDQVSKSTCRAKDDQGADSAR
jgi:hypothetical protein